jgi:hypothetical protein
MNRKKFNINKCIDDSRLIADKICNKKNFEKFSRFLIDELLFNIEYVPFRWIIKNYLLLNNRFYGVLHAHSIPWRYTADLRFVTGWMTYSFRFPNVCNIDLYQSFNVHGKNLFQKSKKPRHHSEDWYQYLGENLLKYIGEYLDVQRIVQVNDPPVTLLFVDQKQKRIDIYFYFKSINTKVTITFEQGTPLRIA